MGQKVGGCCAPFHMGKFGYPSYTIWPGLRPISVPSGILIHPAISPQETWAEKSGGAVSGNGRFLDNHFPRQTFPRQDVSRTRHLPQYTNITVRQTDNGPIAKGEPFYKRSPKKTATEQEHANETVKSMSATGVRN